MEIKRCKSKGATHHLLTRSGTSAGGAITKQVDYAYDAFNRLVKRTYDADGAGSGAATNQYWVYDQGINAVMQFDGSSSSNLSHRYFWSDAVDELMADEIVGTGADTLYALPDHLGTIRDIVNYDESTGTSSIVNHRTYSSFGTLVSETNSAVDLIFGYTGKQLDDATGLQHNLFRWYDSSLGQWMSEDPLSFTAGDENVRRYVGNKPLNHLDPHGKYSTEVILATAMMMAYQQLNDEPKEGKALAREVFKKLGDKFRDKIIETPLVQGALDNVKEYQQWLDDKFQMPWESDPTKSWGPGPWHPKFVKPNVPWYKRIEVEFHYKPKDWMSPWIPQEGGFEVRLPF